jgi:hypothetical protein
MRLPLPYHYCLRGAGPTGSMVLSRAGSAAEVIVPALLGLSLTT